MVEDICPPGDVLTGGVGNYLQYTRPLSLPDISISSNSTTHQRLPGHHRCHRCRIAKRPGEVQGFSLATAGQTQPRDLNGYMLHSTQHKCQVDSPFNTKTSTLTASYSYPEVSFFPFLRFIPFHDVINPASLRTKNWRCVKEEKLQYRHEYESSRLPIQLPPLRYVAFPLFSLFSRISGSRHENKRKKKKKIADPSELNFPISHHHVSPFPTSLSCHRSAISDMDV